MTIKSLRTALSAGFLLVAASGAALSPAYAADKPKQPPMSRGVNKALADAQKASAGKDYAAALAAVQAAQAVADKTPYDQLMINRFMMGVQINLKDLAAADVAAEAAGDTDPAVIPDDTKADVYKPALQLALNNKHFDKALKYAKALQALPPPGDPAMDPLIMQAYYFGGDPVGAAALAQKGIDAAKAAGTRPPRNNLDMVMASQVKAKDEPGAEATLELLVAYYNDPDDWGQIIGVSFGTKGMRDIDYMYLGRLLFVVNGKVQPSDVSLVGNTASRLAFYGDAVTAEKMGGTGFPPADAKADADKKTMPAQIAAGAKQGGQYNVKLAEALYGYGMYPEAEAAARLAQSKGGAADPSEAPMVIGMSLAAEGKYADALTAFGQATGGGPATPRVVRLWTYYVKSKMSPPAPAQ